MKFLSRRWVTVCWIEPRRLITDFMDITSTTQMIMVPNDNPIHRKSVMTRNSISLSYPNSRSGEANI